MKKLILGLALALAANVFAEPQQLGDTSTTWELKDDNTVLVIGGTGAMPDWVVETISDRPWHDVKDSVKSVVVGDGVTSVGEHAFVWLNSLTNATIALTVTSIGDSAFDGCESLTGVAIPANVTSIGDGAFYDCRSLVRVMMNGETPPELGSSAFDFSFACTFYVPAGSRHAYDFGTGWERYKSNIVEAYIVYVAPTTHGTVAVDKDAFPIDGFLGDATVAVTATPDEGYYLKSLVWNDYEDHDVTRDRQFTMPRNCVTVLAAFEKIPMTREETEQVSWNAKPSVSVTPSLELGGEPVGEDVYAAACELYGLAAKPKPTAEDFKAVDKDAQFVLEGEIAVKKESIAAPSAGTVKVEDGKVQLGVAVLKTSDLTAEKKDWSKVKLTKEDIDVDADGNIIVNVPVDSQSGFMVIQTKDAKVGD